MDVNTVILFIEFYNVNHNNKTITGAIYRPPNTDLSPFNLEFEKKLYVLNLLLNLN